MAVVLVAGLSAAMLPLRGHLSVATSALVLVVPVVVGVAVGGFLAGVVAAAVGFVAYDLLFIPPYYTLTVGAAQNWVALVVYAVVTVVAAQVVARFDQARAEAHRRAEDARRLFELSELLVRQSSPARLLDEVAVALVRSFGAAGAAVLVPVGGRLQVVASAGAPLAPSELAALTAGGPTPVHVGGGAGPAGIEVVALSVSDRHVGLLALRGVSDDRRQQAVLRTFANQVAVAVERSDLLERAMRASVLEEVDRLRRSLVGAVSHDLRSPLATIKVATSTLLDRGLQVADVDAKELLSLVDEQADRLDRLVANLLDMTRIQSGALELRRRPTPVGAVVADALAAVGAEASGGRVRWEPVPGLPDVDVDRVLIGQVLANLVDNATRYAPEGSPIEVSAVLRGAGRIEVAVADRGPGVALEERRSIFDMVNRREAGGRGGLGLAIARAFVEVHGERIWVESGHGHQGARFVFSLPVAPAPPGAPARAPTAGQG